MALQLFRGNFHTAFRPTLTATSLDVVRPVWARRAWFKWLMQWSARRIFKVQLVWMFPSIMGLKACMADLGFEMSLQNFSDSSAARAFASCRGLGRQRHVHLWLQERVAAAHLTEQKVKTTQNPADIFTKAASGDTLERHGQMIGLRHVEVHSSGKELKLREFGQKENSSIRTSSWFPAVRGLTIQFEHERILSNYHIRVLNLYNRGSMLLWLASACKGARPQSKKVWRNVTSVCTLPAILASQFILPCGTISANMGSILQYRTNQDSSDDKWSWSTNQDAVSDSTIQDAVSDSTRWIGKSRMCSTRDRTCQTESHFSEYARKHEIAHVRTRDHTSQSTRWDTRFDQGNLRKLLAMRCKKLTLIVRNTFSAEMRIPQGTERRFTIERWNLCQYITKNRLILKISSWAVKQQNLWT